MTARVAEVVAIGDELIHGQGIDTNSAHIARELEALGLHVARFTVVSDEPVDLEPALRDACARAGVVVATGGLGPTADDRTRDVAAAVAGVELQFDEASWRAIEAWFSARGRKLFDSNRRQAWLPAGARALQNRWGTAPGFRLAVGRAVLYALPGVPREMTRMLEAHVLPELRAADDGERLAFHTLRVLGPSEADLGERLEDLMQPGRAVRVGVTAHYGLLTVRIAARAATAEEARRVCDATAAAVRPRLGDDLVYEGDDDLATAVGSALIARGVSFAAAESCTAGLLTASLAAVPGISTVLRGGFVTYDDRRKVEDLGVPAALLDEHGAVSEEVAAAMARGCAERTGARIAVAITGIAGPDGGTDDKPVGTVCFGLCADGLVSAWRRRLAAIGREFVRRRAVLEALAAVWRRLAASP